MWGTNAIVQVRAMCEKQQLFQSRPHACLTAIGKIKTIADATHHDRHYMNNFNPDTGAN